MVFQQLGEIFNYQLFEISYGDVFGGKDIKFRTIKRKMSGYNVFIVFG